jgi:hypothetical protein
MTLLAGLARSVYYFFTEDGSVVVGAVVALIIVGVLARVRPVGGALDVAGPLLFVLIAALLIANLWRTAEQSRR